MALRGKEPKIMIVAGGTGGHLFPGIAVAEGLMELGLTQDISFLVTGKPFEIEALQKRGLRYFVAQSQGIIGTGFTQRIKALFNTAFVATRLYFLLKVLRPDILLCMGAHISGPAAISARLLGIKIAIHEQNTYPGLTNRLLYRISQKVFVSFQESIELLGKASDKPNNKVLVTGNPIRSSMRHKEVTPWRLREECILILGGSQGAKALNDAAVEALNLMKAKGLLPRVLHITGSIHFEHIRGRYKSLGVEAEVYPFREDMEDVYNRATLAVSRAGAGAIFELAYFAIPSILIPYPFAANRHQHLNALAMCRNNAAVLLDQAELRPERLADLLEELLKDRQKLQSMSNAARAFARPEAATVIANEIVSLVERGDEAVR